MNNINNIIQELTILAIVYFVLTGLNIWCIHKAYKAVIELYKMKKELEEN